MNPRLRVVKARQHNANSTGAYIGYAALAKLLACTKKPVTTLQIAEVSGVGHETVKYLMHQFRTLGLVHRCGLFRKAKGFAVPIYQIGEGENVPAPITRTGHPQPHLDFRPKIQPRVMTFACLVKAMQNGPAKRATIIEQAQAAYNCGTGAIKALRTVGLCFVSDYYQRDGTKGAWVALYEYGVDCRDTPKPELPKRRPPSKVQRTLARPTWDLMVQQLKAAA